MVAPAAEIIRGASCGGRGVRDGFNGGGPPARPRPWDHILVLPLSLTLLGLPPDWASPQEWHLMLDLGGRQPSSVQ